MDATWNFLFIGKMQGLEDGGRPLLIDCISTACLRMVSDGG